MAKLFCGSVHLLLHFAAHSVHTYGHSWHSIFTGHFNIKKVQWKELKCGDTLFQFDQNIALSLLLLHDATIDIMLQDYCLKPDPLF